MNKNISDTFQTEFCHVAFRNFYLQLPQIGVMKSQLDLFNNAVIAYFSGNGDKLNEVRIVVQLSLKLNQVWSCICSDVAVKCSVIRVLAYLWCI